MTGILLAMIGVLLTAALAIMVVTVLPDLADAATATTAAAWEHRFELLALLLMLMLGIAVMALHRRLRAMRSEGGVDLRK